MNFLAIDVIVRELIQQLSGEYFTPPDTYATLRILSKQFKFSTDYWLSPMRAKQQYMVFVSENDEFGCVDYCLLPTGKFNGVHMYTSVNGLVEMNFYISGEVITRYVKDDNNTSYGNGNKKVHFERGSLYSVGINISGEYQLFKNMRNNFMWSVFTMLPIKYGRADETEQAYGYILEIIIPNHTIKLFSRRSYIFDIKKDNDLMACLSCINSVRCRKESMGLLKNAIRNKWTLLELVKRGKRCECCK